MTTSIPVITSITGLIGSASTAVAGHSYIAFAGFCLSALVAIAWILRLAQRDRMDNETIKQIIDKDECGRCNLEQFAEVLKSRDRSPP